MKLLITGAAGYLGTNLLKRLLTMNEVTKQKWTIVATDIREPNVQDESIQFLNLDVRSEKLSEIVRDYQIETVVHLASIVTPGKKSNRQLEYDVDVVGTKNVLKACVEHGVKRIVLTSSGAAYGYHADNAEWLNEEHSIRGNKEFAYSYHKRLVEEMLANHRQEYPNLEQVIFRVGTILGDATNNQITSLFEKKALLGIQGSNSPFVFVWDQDVVECLLKGITGTETGIFNVAGDGALTIDDISELLGKPVVRVPAWVLQSTLFVLKRLSLTQYGEEQVNFLRYRPVLDNTKLKQTFGYTPKLSSKEVFQRFVEKRQLYRNKIPIQQK